MFAELTCTCEAHMQVDAEEADACWLLVWRFVNAHVACGYVSAPAQETEDTTTVET